MFAITSRSLADYGIALAAAYGPLVFYYDPGHDRRLFSNPWVH